MKDEILTAAARRDLFLAPEALEIIESNGYSVDFVNTLLNSLSKNTFLVTKKDVVDFLNGDKNLFTQEKVIKPKLKKDLDLQIVPGSDITGQSTCVGNIKEFQGYFLSRYEILRKVIQNRGDFQRALPITKVMEYSREASIIGMIYEKKTTKNGHTILEVEDSTGSCHVLISKTSPLINEVFVNDEVIGIAGKSNGKDLFIADKIYRPDVPANHKWEPSDSVSKIAFLSDIHIGSKEFLRSQWEKMITWMRTNAADQEVNYLVLPGDVVDGIGAYPDQDKDLEIMDIYKQYEALAEYLKELPDHMKIVLHPGNHDACRLAEPQPALNEMFTKSFDSNIYMTGNPINLKVEGRLVTSYHGKSIDDWIAGVRGMSYDDPLRVMKEMVVRRHLAPMYGAKNALAPEKKDYLALEQIPDILVSGHVHGSGKMVYNGVRLINASTWQSQTDYQKQHNFYPNPGIMPIVDLSTGLTTEMNFYKEV